MTNCSHSSWIWRQRARRKRSGEIPPPPPHRRSLPLTLPHVISGRQRIHLSVRHPPRRPALCLTCKRWRHLFYSSPAIWRTLTLAPDAGDLATPGRLSALHGLLARVAPAVEAFECPHWSFVDARAAGSCGGPSPMHFLRLLQPDVATAVSLGGLPCKPAEVAAMGAALVRELLRLPQLTRLELSLAFNPSAPQAGLPAGTPALLLCLPALRHVALESEQPLPAGTLAAIVQLQQLTSLQLQARPLPDLSQLTSLHRLRRLMLVDRCHWQDGWTDEQEHEPPMVLPSPAAFQQGLEQLVCNTISRELQVRGRWHYGELAGLAGRGAAACMLPSCACQAWQRACPAAQYQPCIRCPHASPALVAPPQFAGARLSKLEFSQLEGRQAADVQLEGLGGSTPLAPVLQALLPAGVALHALDLRGSPQPEALLGCVALQHMQVLRLELRFGPGHAAVEALLRQAPALQELEMHMSFQDGAERGRLPPGVVARAGLRALRLPYMGVEDLPPGPYLLGG